MQEIFCFDNDAYQRELRAELETRKKEWARIPGKEVTFVQHEQQKRYDRLKEILLFFEALGYKRVQELQERLAKEMSPPLSLFDD